MSELILTINGKPIEGVIEGNEESLEKIAIKVTGQAKLLAPVDKGQLKNSIMWKTKSTEGGFNDGDGEPGQTPITVKPKPTEAYVGVNLNHAIYQEFGTRKMAPNPYLRPAIAIALGSDAQNILKKINEERMRGALKKGQKRETFIT